MQFIRRPLSLVALSCISFLLTAALPAHAQCDPPGTRWSDLIVCDGVDTAGVDALAGDDHVSVKSGALVDVVAADLPPLLIAISAGDDQDTVLNFGTVNALVSLVQPPPIAPLDDSHEPPVPPHPEPEPEGPISELLLRAIGVAGGQGWDEVINDGTILASVSSDTDNGLFEAAADTPPQRDLAAVGITGDGGNDHLVNNGDLDAAAGVRESTIDVSVSLLGGDDTTASTQIDTYAAGIEGNGGHDRIENTGALDATAEIEVSGIAVEANLLDNSRADVSTHLRADAAGIDGGDGDDEIVHGGTIGAVADVSTSSVGVEVNGADAGLADAELDVQAHATGIAGGRGEDLIEGNAVIDATAATEVDEVGVNVSFVDVTIADREGSSASTTLTSNAAAIDAGAHDDMVRLDQGGALNATATSDVLSVGVSVASEGVPASTETLILEGGLASIGINANSEASGVLGGGGDDLLDIIGDVTASAVSEATQASINVGIAVFDFVVPTPGLVLGSAGTGATAVATGLDGGDGEDTIMLSGALDVDAAADAAATTVSVNIAELSVNVIPDVSGPFGASLVAADTATEATATATGIAGGADDDAIASSGDIDVDAVADGGAVSVAAGMNMQFGEGDTAMVVDALLSRATTEATASAGGMLGDGGDDTLANSGTLSATGVADTTAVSVNVGVNGTIQGDGAAIGISLSDTSNTAAAGAEGMSGGEGDDALDNSGSLEAVARSDVNNVNVTVTAGIVQNGVAVGVGLARSENSAQSDATGMHGGAGENTLANSGDITASAESEVDSVAVQVALEGTADRGLAASVTLTDVSSTATAGATGMRTSDELPAPTEPDDPPPHGDLADFDWPAAGPHVPVLVNSGSISVDADADSQATNVGANVALARQGVAVGVGLADTSATAAAASTAIQADDGANAIASQGDLSLAARADAQAVTVNASIAGTTRGFAAGAALVEAGVNAAADASGINAGAGDDRIEHSGTLTADGVEADATAVGVAASAFVARQGAAIGAALGRTRAEADATAAGIDAGDGEDVVLSSGRIDLDNVDADADAVSVSLSVAATQQGFGVAGALLDSGSEATASARGIAGGNGEDLLVQRGDVDIAGVRAEADAVSVGIGIAGTQNGAVIGAALVDATAEARASASALDGGSDHDWLQNYGSLNVATVNAISDAVGVSVAASIAQNGLTIGGALALTGTLAEASATGMNGGNGNDHMDNYGSVSLDGVLADADSVSVSVGVAAGVNGVNIAAGLLDAAGEAEARASAMQAGEGDDLLLNHGSLSVANVESAALAAGIGVTFAANSAGVAAGITLADTSASASTVVSGMHGGDGEGDFDNQGSVSLNALEAQADSVNVSVALSGNLSGGVAGSAALGRARADADLEAGALVGGDGGDWMVNAGQVSATDIGSDVTVVGTSVGLSVTNAGVALAGALADVGGSASTRVAGFDAGASSDLLRNTGSVELRDIDASVTSVGVGAALNAAISGGVGVGVSVIDASAEADVVAVGLAGGDGRDTLTNNGTVTVEDVRSSAGAVGVSVAVNASMAGLAGGATLVDTSATATTDVTGLAGGGGEDIIANSGDVTVAGRADSNGVSVAVNITAALGVGIGAEIADATSAAISTATGIDGGGGRDDVFNSGTVDVSSVADADATTVAVGATVAVGGNATLANATTTATAEALGINGDEDVTGAINEIGNQGAITAAATSTSTGTAVAGNLVGLAFGETTNNSTARATGLRGSSGQDRVDNRADLSSTSNASADGININVSLLGGALGDASTTAESFATGIATAAGDDEIANSGVVDVDAVSSADAVQVSAGTTGLSLFEAATDAVATATGIDAGDGGTPPPVEPGPGHGEDPHAPPPPTGGGPLDHTLVVNTSSIDARASADAGGVNVSARLLGAALGDSANTATGEAFGIRSGDSDDLIRNEAVITSRGTASVSGTQVGVALGGAALLDADSTANGVAAGISSGAGRDQIVNNADLGATARASASATSVSVSFAGVANADAETLASARAMGIDGGADDDVIVNDGSIVACAGNATGVDLGNGCTANVAGATASMSTVTVPLLGAGSIDTSFTADALATGLDGGAGNDWIETNGDLDATARARVGSSNVNVNIAGVASTDVSTIALANAQGVTGAGGDDAIRTSGNFEATSRSEVSISATNVSLAGVSNFNSTIFADSVAAGIRGGDGNDDILNGARLDSSTSSVLSAGGGSTVIFGASGAGARSGAGTSASGIRGDAGNDLIGNTGTVTAASGATLTLGTTSFSFGGSGSTGGTLAAGTGSVGIHGDDGEDFLDNSGEVRVSATSTLSGSNNSNVAFGGSSVGAAAGAITDVTGLGGGDGADTVLNRGFVQSTSTASLTMSGSQFTFGGSGNSGATLSATTRSAGITGGSGADMVQNQGRVVVTATASMSSSGNSDVAFGSSSAGAGAVARTDAVGIDTGGEDDGLLNTAEVNVSSTATISMSNSQFTFGGGGSTSNRMSADTASRGLVTGAGNDIVDNAGLISVGAISRMTASGGSDVAFGSSGASSSSGATTNVAGIDTGSGDDSVLNRQRISASSSSTLSLSGSTFTFGGSGATGGRLSASTRTAGIRAGDGNDVVRNEANIDSTASTSLGSSGGSETVFGDSAASAAAQASTGAHGIEGEGGDDVIENTATIRVSTTANATSGNSTYTFGGGSSSNATARSFAISTGISGDSGNDSIVNAGTIDVFSGSTISTSGSSYTEFGGSTGSGTVVADAQVFAIRGGSGNDYAENSGNIIVQGRSSSSSSHNADTGFLFGGGDSRAASSASMRAYGMHLESGNNEGVNSGSISLAVRSRSSASTSSDGADVFDGDAFSRSDTSTSLTAIGMAADSGNDTLTNDGSISISTVYAGLGVNATSSASADGDGIDGDGTGRAHAHTSAWAAGIAAGHGTNAVINNGQITVVTTASVTATTSVDADAGGTARSTRNANMTGRAYGIHTGDGADTITNAGTINVVAATSRSGSEGSHTNTAVGISTGAGADVVINTGTITATRVVSGIPSGGTIISAAGTGTAAAGDVEEAGIAIDLGDGDDTVMLMDASTVWGDIDLGRGANSLHLEGTPTLTGNIRDAESNLALAFHNAGSFAGDLPGATAVKDGDGTFSLTMLRSLDRLTVNGGVLRLENDYTFAAGGEFRAAVYGDGRHGRFEIDGAAALDGGVHIDRGAGAYRDATGYTVLTAGDGFSGGFGEVTLPAATPLLSFDQTTGGDALAVTAAVQSYTTVARSGNQASIARQLDRLLPSAAGDLSLAMGEVQFIADGDYEAAFSSLSPATYDSYRAVTFDAVSQYRESLHGRLGEFHALRGRRSSLVNGRPARAPDAWVRAFGQRGEREQRTDVNDYDYTLNGVTLGVDWRLDPNWLTGVSAGYASSEVDSASARSSGGVDTTIGSAFASYVRQAFHVDAVLSFGRGTFDTRRELVIGDLRETVDSRHSGELTAASLGAGYFTALGAWSLEPYAVFQYTRLDEDGFEENGSGASLVVAARRSESAVSRLGARFVLARDGLSPELRAGWNHDHGIDDYRVDAAFAGAPQERFSVDGEGARENWYSLGAALRYRGDRGLSTSLEYSGEFSDGFQAHGVMGEVSLRF